MTFPSGRHTDRRYHRPITTTAPHPDVSAPTPAAPRNGGGAGQDPNEAGRIGTMRGASVQADGRRLARIALGFVVGVLVVLAVSFTVAGMHANQQIDRIHAQGVSATYTVSDCVGLLGGSGTNAAGYTCHGSYDLRGTRYRVTLPGTDFHAPGAKLAVVAVPGDPTLVAPVSMAAARHASASVFILPAVLAGCAMVIAGLTLLTRRPRTGVTG